MYVWYLPRFSFEKNPISHTKLTIDNSKKQKMAMVKISHQSFTDSEELGKFGDCYESFRTHN